MHRQPTILRLAAGAVTTILVAACQRADVARGDTAAVPLPVAAGSAADAFSTPDSVVGTGADPTASTRPPSSGAAGAAAPPPRTGAATPAPSDTVRGTVAEVGSIPVTSIVVRPATGGSIPVVGDLAREIGRAAGAEVWVEGRRTTEGIEARRYAVRSVDGEPALDGTLSVEGDRVMLETESGRRPIARPPQALRSLDGARVWLVGSVDDNITSYGVLRDAP